MASSKKDLINAKRKLKKHFVISKLRVFIFIILVVAIGCTYFVKQPIENFVADIFNVNIERTEFGTIIKDGDLQVHFIDVGQGDSIAIRFPDDKTMLIDAGDKEANKTLIPYLNNVFFANDEEKEFDYALLTHSDSDHCGSMDEVYDEFQVNISIRPYVFSTKSEYEMNDNVYNALEKDTIAYKDYIDSIYLENDVANDADIIFAQAGLTITSDDPNVNYLMEFLTPNDKYYTNVNDYSPIILLEYQDKSMLFTGDAAEKQFEELDELITTNIALRNRLDRVTVYKAAHHGSALEGCNSLEVLQKINPEYVVICCGEGNKYHHPHQEFLDNLISVNVLPENIYRTDLNQNIIFGISKDDATLNINSDLEIDPNSSYFSNSDAPVILYYSWWMIAGFLIFICAIICFYNYKRIVD